MPEQTGETRRGRAARPRRAPAVAVEPLERRALLAAGRIGAASASDPVLTPAEVEIVLQRAAAASASSDAIIAVVDRNGRILGVRAEDGVAPAITGDTGALVFAVDGAVAKARTAAMFANNQAPLTSRTIQLISQTTMTQREIEANPNVHDPDSTLRGPGFVAPVGPKGHFPPRVPFTPQVDLFAIEHTNRDSILHPGPDRIKGTPDDVLLPARFNVDPAFLRPGVTLYPPESYGLVSGLLPGAQARGIATLPGGVPLVRNGQLVGGIGVFFPGDTGFATEENSALNTLALFDPRRRDRSLEAEYIAFAAAGGTRTTPLSGVLNGAPPLKGFTLPFGRIDLVGITLDLFGSHGLQGLRNLLRFGRTLGPGDPNDGDDLRVTPDPNVKYLAGEPVPEGWLVLPHDGVNLTAQEVERIVQRGVVEAFRIRAAIRLPLDSSARMIFAVTDTTGEVLGLFRMKDATVFSMDVAVAKARNVAYYADAGALQPADRIAGVPPGTAFTNRTFRYASLPRFPEGIDVYPPGPFSILTDGSVLPDGRTQGAPLPASAFTSVQGYDAFNPNTNFRDPDDILNQNGIVFFPGSAPLYKDLDGDGTKELVGGLGVSGDGVDQDDDVTFAAQSGFEPPGPLRADFQTVRGVRLPYQKFNRQPHIPVNGQRQALKLGPIPLPKGPLRQRGK